jgi:hypothetical protein
MINVSSMRKLICGLLLLLICFACAVAQQDTKEKPGFSDTPYLPDGKWRVHDSSRPRSTIITPGSFSTQEQPGRPPSDAIVLFDGTDLSKWQTRQKDGTYAAPKWKVENGYMEVVGRSGSIETKQKFGDCQIHVEWASPTTIEGNGQGRGNSGVLIMGRYEIQVLDTYNNPSYSDGQTGAMYGQYPPLVLAVKEPGKWQVYDIIFEAPRFDKDDNLVKPAYVTVILNGVVLHHRQAFIGSVAWKRVGKYAPHEPVGPLQLQDHGNPVRFRNVWIRPLGEYPGY